MSVIDEVLKRNESYAKRFTAGKLDAPPRLRLAVLTCMDARLETGSLLGLREGEAHKIRNAGGVVTEDVIRSLSISQSVLGTREIMVIMHTACGMAAMDEDALRRHIAERTGTEPDFPLETFTDLEAAVRSGCAKLAASPLLLHRDAIRGFVYDVRDGRLREVPTAASG